jgi:S-adenosylmethionine:tRNA ribosyltransferase-isomerase
MRLFFSDALSAVMDDRVGDEMCMTFECRGDFESVLQNIGLPPLPPYIIREAISDYSAEDRARYQTVYAQHAGSAAAPTAGLHLTETLLAELRAQGAVVTDVTLHVGRDTFQPLRVDAIHEHAMHGESFVISEETAAIVTEAKRDRRRVIAVGTTSVRALESAWDVDHNRLVAGSATTHLFMTPGFRFQVIDGLMTNFHQPKSTLLMLVSAFLGRERVLALYAEAIRQRYRLFSFGDGMWITE